MIFNAEALRTVDRQATGLLITNAAIFKQDQDEGWPLVGSLSSGRGQHCPAEIPCSVGDLQV
jgi:hypothetical protein